MSRGSKKVMGVLNVPSKPRFSSKQAGFGLIETVISIILFAGFLLSTGHLLLSIFSSKLLDQTALRFIDSFQMARQAAIENNSKVMIKPISENWEQGWEVYAIYPAQKFSAEQSKLLFRQKGLEKVIKVQTQEELTVVFKPNGMTSNLNPLGDKGVVFCNANGQGRKLTMLASGQMQVKEINQGCGVS